ncbi:MAG: hypothetical protein WC718_12800 [Phycisphaerales bacterium]|jgi:hypothetical protein
MKAIDAGDAMIRLVKSGGGVLDGALRTVDFGLGSWMFNTWNLLAAGYVNPVTWAANKKATTGGGAFLIGASTPGSAVSGMRTLTYIVRHRESPGIDDRVQTLLQVIGADSGASCQILMKRMPF